ncbi:hypothetical protein [Paraclostridium dentum]|uniref:hypothetical protein n=1 Tax=Paraclostridium dentum TaxID=2662455 RepID=UPI003464D81B
MMNDIINIIKDKINDFKAKYDTNPDYVIIGVYDFLKIINDINNLEQDVITVQPIIGSFRIFGVDIVVENNRNSGDIYIAGSPRIEINRAKEWLAYDKYINEREYEKLMGIYRYIEGAAISNKSEFLENKLQTYNKKN